jgi:hypothetical protein
MEIVPVAIGGIIGLLKNCFARVPGSQIPNGILSFLVGSMLLHAQNLPTVSRGNLELGLFGGESYGLDRFRPMGGANIAYGFSRRLYPFFEASYLPGILRKFPVTNSASFKQASTDLTDFHGGIHFRFVRGETRVIPYAVLGTGVIHASDSQLTTTFVFPDGTSQTAITTIPSKTSWEVNFGGGLRFFFTERFGLRLEMKAFKPTSAPAGVDNTLVYRFAIGPYFQLR